MRSYIRVALPQRNEFFKPSVEIGLDKDWKRKRKEIFGNSQEERSIPPLYEKSSRYIIYWENWRKDYGFRYPLI